MLAQVFEAESRFEDALQTAEQALTLLKEVGDKSNQVEVLLMISRILLSAPRSDRSDIQRVRLWAPDQKTGKFVAELPEKYVVKERANRAIRSAKEAITLSEKLESAPQLASSYYALSEAYEKCGKGDEASQAALSAISLY